jgi:DNA polymerase III alpha subunit (gram-positive type)
MTPFLYSVQLIEDFLRAEERAEPVQNLTYLASRRARRFALEQALADLEASVARLRTRWRSLAPLPDEESIRWAQAVRQLPNLAFLELDTDGLSDDADLIRVVLQASDGSTLYAQTIQPPRPISEKITALTAVRPEEVEHAPTFAQTWPDLCAALQGRYILSYNLPFDRDKLRQNAERFGVEPVALIGECLMQRSQHYFHLYSYPKLAELCRRIGFPLPDHPLQSAWDRARGQIHLVEAMSQGITAGRGEPKRLDVDDGEEDEEPPF